MGSRNIWFGLVGLFGLGLLLTLGELGASGLWDPWEPRYAQTAREMAEAGEWIVPRYRESPRLVKPPLTYWMIAVSQSFLGTGEAASRLPSALLALVGPLLLAWAGVVRGHALAGWIAGAALLTSPQWLLLGRSATPDIPLAATFAGLLAIAIAMPAVERRTTRNALGVAVILLLVAAVLVDGLRGLILPAWGVLLHAALRGGRRWVAVTLLVTAAYAIGQQLYIGPLVIASHLLAILAALTALHRRAGLSPGRIALATAGVVLLALPWFLLAWQAEPTEFVKRILSYKHALNLGETPGDHTAGVTRVLELVSFGSFPWIGAAAYGLYVALRERREPLGTLAGGALGALLFFTLSEAKMGHFYGTVQPAIAGLAGWGLAAVVDRSRRVAPAAVACAGVVLLGVTIALWIDPAELLAPVTVFDRFDDVVDPRPWILAAGVGWLFLATVGLRRRRPGWFAATLLPAVLLSGFLVHTAVPNLGDRKGLRGLWRAYEESGVTAPPVVHGQAKDTVFYYSDNNVLRLKSFEEVVGFLERSGDRFVIAPRGAVDDLRSATFFSGEWVWIYGEHPTHVLVEYRAAD